MIIYIAGRMTGLPDKGRALFKKAEDTIREAGHIPLNPALLPDNMPREKYMPICMAMLEAADAIFMLGNWEDSNGAALERIYAQYQGKVILMEGENLSERDPQWYERRRARHR